MTVALTDKDQVFSFSYNDALKVHGLTKPPLDEDRVPIINKSTGKYAYADIEINRTLVNVRSNFYDKPKIKCFL